MRRFAALVSLALTLVACKVDAEAPEGFVPGMAVEPEPMEETACETVARCLSLECDFSLPVWCDVPENADAEQCSTVDADLEECVAMCAAEHPEASERDLMLAVAGEQCNAAIITAEDAAACNPIGDECFGPE